MNCYSHIFILFQNPKNLYITEKSGLFFFFFYEKPNRSAGQAHVSESLKLSWHQRCPGSQTDWGMSPGVQAGTRPLRAEDSSPLPVRRRCPFLPLQASLICLLTFMLMWSFFKRVPYSRSDFYSLQSKHAWAPSQGQQVVQLRNFRWLSGLCSPGPWQSALLDFLSSHKASFPLLSGFLEELGDRAGILRFVFA